MITAPYEQMCSLNLKSVLIKSFQKAEKRGRVIPFTFKQGVTFISIGNRIQKSLEICTTVKIYCFFLVAVGNSTSYK